MSVAIVGVVFGATIEAYIQTAEREEWTGYSLAAQSMAQQLIEQARSSVWDPAQYPAVNQVTNLSLSGLSFNAASQTWTGYTTNILDVPYANTNYTMATNYVTIQVVYVNGSTNVLNQFIRVDCVWPFGLRAGCPYFTNTVCTLIAPDNRDPNTF